MRGCLRLGLSSHVFLALLLLDQWDLLVVRRAPILSKDRLRLDRGSNGLKVVDEIDRLATRSHMFLQVRAGLRRSLHCIPEWIQRKAGCRGCLSRRLPPHRKCELHGVEVVSGRDRLVLCYAQNAKRVNKSRRSIEYPADYYKVYLYLNGNGIQYQWISLPDYQ
ncbi:unnamed protein product [Microthlaspi erraticum]|uniref:Secreted protein n=1 Tax=Microthlaspi erraticum TaxID=1685480 RepID=A0A6D2I545_9BRAS|nr:unnamed protein product [Microthlaspi erraticum]